MPEEPTGTVSPRLEQLIERLERENRWWRGGLIAALVFIGLMMLVAGRHRRHVDVTVTVPPWALRRPYWFYGPSAHPAPPPGWGGGERGPGMMMPGEGPNPPAQQPPSQ